MDYEKQRILLYKVLSSVRNRVLRGDGYHSNDELARIANEFIAQEISGHDLGIDFEKLK